MPKPRRTTADAFYDVFADFTIEDQVAALRILEQIHRLAVREAKRHATAAPATGTKLYVEVERLSDLGDPSDPRRNAALLLEEEGGPKQ